MANNNQADDSSLVEDLGVLTASTAAGTALFFRLENPARLNEYAIKADLYMTEVKKLWAENINNLPGLTTAKLDNVVQTVNAKYNDIGPGGASFRLSNTASVNRIVDYYSKRIYSKELIKNFYTGESASIALRTFNSLNIQNEAVRTVLADQIEKMAQTPEDFIQIKASLQARLNYDDYQEAVRYGEAIRDDILTWQKENPLNIWEQGAGSRRLESYLDVTLSDPEQMWIEQEARKNGLTGRIANFIYGDTRAATFKDLIDLYDNGTPEQKKYVRNLLRNSVSINATADELLRSGLFQQGNDLFDKVAGETAITKGAVGIEDIEILKAYRNDLNDDTKRRFFDMLEIDNLRFDKNGRLFTTSDFQSVAQRFGKELGKVTPLNLLHLSDIIVAAQDTRTSLYLNAGTKDFVSAKLVLNQADDQVLNKPVYFNDGHVFVLEGDEFIERKDLANQLEIHNRRVGVTRRTYEAFAGYQKSPYLTEDTPSILGMSITKWEETLEYGNNANLFGKITQDNANVITNALNVIAQNSNVAEEEMYRAVGVVNGLRRYTDFLTKRTTTMDLVSARRLRNALGNTNRDASQLLDLIIELNENKTNLETVMTRLVKAGSLKDRNSFNPYLNRTINAYIYDPQSIRQRLNTRRDPMGYSKGKYVTVDYIESLTDELANEFYARYSKDNGVAGLFEFLTENLDEKEANEAKSAAAIFDYRRRLNFPGLRLDDGTDRVAREFSNVAKGFQDFVSDINKGNTDAVAVKNQIEYINKVFGYDFEREGENIRLSVMQQMSQDGLVLKPGAIYNKSQDIIKEINEGHLNKAFGLGLENVYRGVGQLWSGRSSVNSYTRYSAIGGHLMFRLNDMLREVDNFMLEGPGFKSLGLNVHLALRPEDTTSGGAIFKNLLLKRVAPVVATYKALEFADDIADAVLGRGIFETALSGAANIDLAFRKATDATGLTSVLDNLLKDNAIAEYISGYGDDTPGFYSYEQEKHYYEKGYTAIRKARFWDFGSSNEFRGGRISYWEPNTLRLVSSDYRDESLYNGEFWIKYSPWQLIDPYYLEHLHYEDRPYPVSGSMFADSTPWGIVLNATIGDLIKPKIKMHTNRLQDGQDVQAIIYHINEAIRNKENSNLFYMEMGRLKSMAFNAYNAPTYSERIVSVNNEGEVTAAGDYGAYYTPMAISSDTYGKMVDSLIANQSPQLTFSDKINIAAARGNPLARLAAFGTKQSALNILRQNNQSIYARSLNSDATAKAGYDKTQGYMREEGLGGYDPVEQLLSDSDTVAELLQAGSANDYVQQMAISARMLGGIYGWMASNATGLGDNKYDRIATSADMYSFSRRFWDSGIGGFGGDTMEIIRRVIPEYRRFQTVNPLMNTMPDWLPERFRFGDPYCVSKDTLIEVNELDFIEADQVNINDVILTHKANNIPVENLAIRPIEENEKVYKLKISTLSAIESKFSEKHPILVCKTPQMRRLKPFIKINIYEQANKVLEDLNNGITNKRVLANNCGSNIDDISRIFKLLYENDLIFDYKLDKHNITLKEYKPFDLDILKRDLEWKYVKDIKVGDYVVYPLPKYEEQEILLDLTEYIKDYPYTDKYIYISGTLKNPVTAEIYEWSEKHGELKFARGQRKTFLKEHGWERYERTLESVQQLIRYNKIPERIPRYIKLTPELCYAFGVYLAEGWITESGIGLSLNISEEWIANKVLLGLKTVFPNVRMTFKQVKNTNGAQALFYGKYVGILIKALFGEHSHHKRIPNLFWNAFNECILRLLEGYFDGDGSNFVCNSDTTQKEIERVCLASCNLKLLLQVRKLLLRFNVVCGIQKKGLPKKTVWFNNKSINTGLNYNLIVRGKNASRLAILLWGYQEAQNVNDSNRIANWYFISEGYVYMRVLDIKECPEIKEVYGFQVSTDHSFCTAGLATHNTSVPNGEARLPGRGYESLNELHSDIYVRYGAFDRFKILADIAPYSAEYKFWKRVVQKTVKDPELQAEIEEIKDRVAEQSRQHDFAPYKYVGRDVERQNVVITEVLANGQFKVFGSDQTYKLAGVRVKPNENETGEEVLARYLTPGTEATLVFDTNPAYARNDDKAKSINAALVINGESLGDIMLQNNDAVERANDNSAASYMARHGTFVNTVNYLSEALMHADIPVFHSRWLRANDALEDYLDEYLYGVSFQSWDDVLETFVIPNMRKAASSEFWTAAGITTDILRNNIMNGQTTRYNMLAKWFTETYEVRKLVNKNASETIAIANPFLTKHIGKLQLATDRGALMGKLAGSILTFGQSEESTISSKFRRGGTMLTLGYSALVAPESLDVSLMSWSRLGYMASEYLEGRHGGKLALAGAAIGLARWAGTVKLLNGTDTLQDQYIPTSARERWEIQDYFDRLTYIKYMALYDEAAEMALSEEGTDIRKIIESQDKEYREIRESKKELEKIIEDIGTPRNAEEEQLLKDLRARLRNTSPTRVALTGGEYTKSAIMYYNAARATMYALDETSSMTDIVRALPKTERDYFMEFVQEKDPEKRQEILSYVSPSLQRALRMLWYGDFTRPESNESFFADHELPAPTWGGWNPNVDLEDVMAKTIQNEGMLASDFGIYTSQYEEPGVINAPEIDNWNSGNGTMIAALNIQMLLNGAGLIGTEVSVEPQQDSTLQVIANIGRVVEYNIDQEINKLFDLL